MTLGSLKEIIIQFVGFYIFLSEWQAFYIFYLAAMACCVFGLAALITLILASYPPQGFSLSL